MMRIFGLLILLAFGGALGISGARHGLVSRDKSGGEVVSESSSSSDRDLVTDLPGQPSVGFKHYAGYVTVDDDKGRALFYWFYEAMTRPDEKPLVLWLNGGPGCSSVGYGATQEIGPFIIESDGRGLKFNPNAWNKAANMLFLESPAGVGFSYSNTTTDYSILGDEFTANDSYIFLHKWLDRFPSYRNRSFYIAGESYAGKYVPALAQFIHDRNEDPSLRIDLKGFLVGNPETSDGEDWEGLVDYAWSHAVVSDETHQINQGPAHVLPVARNSTWDNEDCRNAVDEVLNQYKGIDMYSLYTSPCSTDSSTSSAVYKLQNIRKPFSNMMPRIMGGYDPCLDNYAKVYYNRAEVQMALHVSDGHHLKNWSICNNDIFDGWKYSMPSVLPIYKKLIAAGLRVWVYSGDTDGRVPVLATRYSLIELGLPITRPWAYWYHQQQVAGWFQQYKGLTFATFRGAGHAVPIFKPSESLAFFTAFLAGEIVTLERENKPIASSISPFQSSNVFGC